MDDVIPEHTAGPGKLRVFLNILLIVIMMVFLGSVLDTVYGIPWILDLGIFLANNTLLLFELAGLITVGLLLYGAAKRLE